MRGTGSYPENWQEIALGVKDAAGWRCARCNHPTRRVVKESDQGSDFSWVVGRLMPCDEHCRHEPDGKKRMLTVHHLDGNKGNCAWWNLTPLCQKCHLEIQAKVIMGQLYLHEHSEWFKPYAAGFYAYVILRESLSREEVMARLDELLLLGQPHLQEDTHG